MTNFNVSSVGHRGKLLNIEAIILRKVTSDLPMHTVPFREEWNHLSKPNLADPEYGKPGPIDLLLGTEVFGRVVLHGRRFGPVGTPLAFKTHFGWVLAGTVHGKCDGPPMHNCCHVAAEDDELKKFWEIEECNLQQPILSSEERAIIQHFERKHTRNPSGRFMVPLPTRTDTTPLGES